MLYDVKVKPNSKKGPLVEVLDNTHLVVYIREKPHDGAANVALIELLAKHFKVPKTTICIKSGVHAKTKIVEI